MAARPTSLREAFPAMSSSFMRLNAAVLAADGPRIDEAASRLHGSPQEKQTAPRPKDGAGGPVERETDIQQQLIAWWADNWQRLGAFDERQLMAFPLQGSVRGKKRGARMKMEGARAGTPDLLLAAVRRPVPFSAVDQGSAGLWIEMKTEAGTVRESQREMHLMLARAGYEVVVCRSLDEAQRAIAQYLLVTK